MKKSKHHKGSSHRSATLPKTDICQNCGRQWREDQLEEITHGFWERVGPGEICPSGECPKCGAVCHPIENALTPYKNALKSLLDTVQATGGLIAYSSGTFAPEAERDWIDLGDVIQQARKLIPSHITVRKVKA
ncbi:MAG: hypothetical protein ACRD4C_08100 [Candidatus Acidiferrales bacterium]